MRVGITMRVPRESVTMENYQTKKRNLSKPAFLRMIRKIKRQGTRNIYGMIKHA